MFHAMILRLSQYRESRIGHMTMHYIIGCTYLFKKGMHFTSKPQQTVTRIVHRIYGAAMRFKLGVVSFAMEVSAITDGMMQKIVMHTILIMVTLHVVHKVCHTCSTAKRRNYL